MLKAGADLAPESDGGNSALDLAYKYGTRDSVQLIKMGSLALGIFINLEHPENLTQNKFREAVTRVLKGRGWKIVKQTENRVYAQYKKGRRIFKIIVQQDPDNIIIRYLPYFGAKKMNYLINIQRDLGNQLGL